MPVKDSLRGYCRKLHGACKAMKTGIIIEKYGALSIFFVACIAFKLAEPAQFLDKISNCVSDLISFFAILIGFSFTSLSILFSYRNRPFVKIANTYGGFNRLIGFHKSAITWGIATCLTSLLYKLSDFIGSWFLLGVVVASCFAIAQMFFFFFKFISLDLKK